MKKFLFFQQENKHLGDFSRYEAALISEEAEQKIVHAYSLYSVPNPHTSHNSMYLNSLSSFRSYISGKVQKNLTAQEYKIYQGQNPQFSENKPTAPILLENIIQTFPSQVDYMVIPMAEKSLDFLRKYYWKIGEILQEKSLVSEIGNLDYDRVYYKIQK